MKYIIFFFPLLIFSKEISTIKYGELLYNNPRGISCAKCHGKKGKGIKKIFIYYDDNTKLQIIDGVDISLYSLDELRDSLNDKFKINNKYKKHKIMPKYYLIDKEIKAIFKYLKSNR